MTSQIVNYTDKTSMKADKAVKVAQGFRAIHTDFINNKESDGFQVTYDNTIDPPDSILERTVILEKKLNNDIISFNELKELLRLRL